jgi:hypothetical protein
MMPSEIGYIMLFVPSYWIGHCPRILVTVVAVLYSI